MKVVLRIFPSPKAHIDMGMPNPIYWHISLYSFIFLNIASYFLHILWYFPHILTYFRHISSYFWLILSYFDILFLHISFIFTTSRNSRMWRHQGGCTHKSWNYPLGPPDLNIFPSPPGIFSNGHFPECDVIGGGGVLANPNPNIT